MLEVDIERMEDELLSMKLGIIPFETFVTKAFTDEVEDLEAMHSDFITELIKVLNNMQDDNGDKVLKRLKEYVKLGENIIKELKENQDEAMANQMGETAE